ncbi:hypothetical protein V1522DRAFT_2164 [Lipomyces starkeyi]
MVSFSAILWPSLGIRRARYHRVRSLPFHTWVPVFVHSSMAILADHAFWRCIYLVCLFHSFTLFLLHHPGDYASTYAPQSSINSQKKLRKEFYEMAALLSLSGILGDVFRINMIYSEESSVYLFFSSVCCTYVSSATPIKHIVLGKRSAVSRRAAPRVLYS